MEDYLGMSGGIAGIITLVVGIAIKMNHKRIRSKCCGKNIEVSVDVESTTPVEKSQDKENARPPDISLQEVKSQE
jgi:hypothetical protein